MEETSGPYGTTVEIASEGGILYRGEDGFTAPAVVFAVAHEPVRHEGGDHATWGPLVDVDRDGHPDILARDLQTEDAHDTYGPSISMDVLWSEPLP